MGTGSYSENSYSSRKALGILVAATLFCLVPFVDKPFHIDDPLFLWSAKHIQEHPGDFYGFKVNWTGHERLIAHVTQNPPLTSYVLALAALLFGWSEIALHLTFIVPALAVVLGTWYLARQLCAQPLLAALMALATPVFLVSSTNVMCDTMMLALWVWAVGFWLRGTENGNLRLFAASSILAALAVITKFFAVSLIPLLFAYSLMKNRGLAREQSFLLVPAATIIGYEWITYFLYGHGHFSGAMDFTASSRAELDEPLLFKGLIGLSFIGGCMATVLVFSPLLRTRKILPGMVLIFILLLVFMPFLLPNNPSFKNTNWPLVFQFVFFISGAIGLLGLAAIDFWKHKNADSLLLLLWIFGTFIFAAFINWMINARSILTMIPVMGILMVRRLENPGSSKEVIPFWHSAWPLIPSMVLALLATSADYQMAANAKKAAGKFIKEYGKGPGPLLFAGHWGFQYYMEAGGAKPLRPALSDGDTLVIPKDNILPERYPIPESSVRWRRTIKQPFFPGLATMNHSLGAGFYSHSWGFLPWVFGRVPSDQYTVLRIRTS